MRQTSRGALTLRSADPLDAPFIDPDYLATETDRRELRESYDAIMEVVAQRAFDPYRGKPLDLASLPRTQSEVDALVRSSAQTAFHLCGTCKMGSALDPLAVVDPQTRVRGLTGLRIADASIMPSIVSTERSLCARRSTRTRSKDRPASRSVMCGWREQAPGEK